MKKIVLLDIDDTLLDFQACSKISLMAAFDACHLEYKDDYHPVFIELNAKLWQQLERQEINEEELFERRFRIIFDCLHLDGDKDVAEIAFRRALDQSHEVKEGAKDLLSYLSDDYDLYIASNSQHERQVNRLKKAGLLPYFKDIFTSGRLNATKPSYEFFERCFDELNHPDKQDVYFIGDSYSADIQGALNYGITPIWINEHPEQLDIIQVKELAEIKHYL